MLATDVRPEELAVAATFRVPPAGTGTSFVELSRRHGDYAMCGVAAVVTRTDGRTTARVALLGVGDGPVRVDVTEATADGRVDPGAVADLVDPEIDPGDDIHATAAYRRHLAHVLVERALNQAGGRAA